MQINMKTYEKKFRHLTLLTIVLFSVFCSLQVGFATNHTITDSSNEGIRDGISKVDNGGTLTLNPGIYDKPGNDVGITIGKSLTIQGNGSPDQVIIDAKSKSRIFEMANGLNVTFINLTFTNGWTSGSGAAIYNNHPGTVLTFINCIFVDNNADGFYGGAIFNKGHNLQVINSTFTNNHVDYGGGAIFNMGHNSYVGGSTFTGNSAYGGGAIFNYDGTHNMIIVDSTFMNNEADSGGAIYYNGNNLYVSGSTFTKNTANQGGAITVQNGNNFVVEDSYFIENNAVFGGAFLVHDNVYGLSVASSTFMGNTAEHGNALYNMGHDSTVADSKFLDEYGNIDEGAVSDFGKNLNIVHNSQNEIQTKENQDKYLLKHKDENNLNMNDNVPENYNPDLNNNEESNNVNNKNQDTNKSDVSNDSNVNSDSEVAYKKVKNHESKDNAEYNEADIRNTINDNPVANSTMKKTGLPLFAIFLVLVSLVGVVFNRRRN